MIVTDVCSPSKRADALGKLGISYGVGMVVGPMIGGIVSRLFRLARLRFVFFSTFSTNLT